MRSLIIFHLAAFASGFLLGAMCSAAEEVPGKAAFEKRCGGCHSADAAKEGPALRAILGRRAGTQPSFPYSDALKGATFEWDRPTLDRWLADPESVAPGTDMAFRLTNKDERSRIIEYLARLK